MPRIRVCDGKANAIRISRSSPRARIYPDRYRFPCFFSNRFWGVDGMAGLSLFLPWLGSTVLDRASFPLQILWLFLGSALAWKWPLYSCRSPLSARPVHLDGVLVPA